MRIIMFLAMASAIIIGLSTLTQNFILAKPQDMLRDLTIVDGSKFDASGFMINSKFMITNKHVIQSRDGTIDKDVKLFDINGNRAEFVRYIQHPKLDLALIEIKTGNGFIAKPVNIRCDFPEYGEKLTTFGKVEWINFGFTELTNITYIDGNIDQSTEKTNDSEQESIGNNLFLRGYIQPGNSGGPVFDKYGSLVGIATAYLNSQVFVTPFAPPTHLGVSVAISSPDLCNWFDSIKIQYKKG